MSSLDRELAKSLRVALSMTEAYQRVTDEVVDLAAAKIVAQIQGLPNELRLRVLQVFDESDDPATLLRDLTNTCEGIHREIEHPLNKAQRMINGGELITFAQLKEMLTTLGVFLVIVLCLWGAIAIKAENERYELNQQEQVR